MSLILTKERSTLIPVGLDEDDLPDLEIIESTVPSRTIHERRKIKEEKSASPKTHGNSFYVSADIDEESKNSLITNFIEEILGPSNIVKDSKPNSCQKISTKVLSESNPNKLVSIKNEISNSNLATSNGEIMKSNLNIAPPIDQNVILNLSQTSANVKNVISNSNVAMLDLKAEASTSNCNSNNGISSEDQGKNDLSKNDGHKIFFKEFLSALHGIYKFSQVIKCNHSKDPSKILEICSVCCWPMDTKLAFQNENVQAEMLDKIITLGKISLLQNHLLAKFLIQYFSKTAQNKVKNVLGTFFIPKSNDLEEELEEELGFAATFNDYKPSKLKIGCSHPDSVIETSSLSSVEPPDITYKLSIPEETIDGGKLSSLQLETITYSSQRYEHFFSDGTRAGFLIGDGAGVGKGRTIAGVIYENYLKNRKKSVWISVSNDLKYDAERDLRDIGANIEVKFLAKFPYGKITGMEEGVLFGTYSALVGHTRNDDKTSPANSRMAQILDWCGEGFDGCIVFDECHKAKNLVASNGRKPTKTGFSVLKLQNQLPSARVFYASATGASEPKNMAYMVRLGIWGSNAPFKSFEHFNKAVERRGVGAMEVIALDMKLRGAYLARQLSFQGVSFRIEEIKLSNEYRRVYDKSCKLWVEALKFYEAVEQLVYDPKKKKSMWALFWASHQRFFKYLCISVKVEHTVRLAQKAISEGKCVVIGLQMTGEAATNQELIREGGELHEFVSTTKGVFYSLIDRFSEDELKVFGKDILLQLLCDPKLNKKKKLDEDNRLQMISKRALILRKYLVSTLAQLAPQLPLCTLDELVHRLGGPEKVSEMTGRKGRVVDCGNGERIYMSRCAEDEEMNMVNMNEKEKFMNGEKDVAIISEAASSGISLQSDRRVKNQKRRVHITLELPWSADRAIQQFGRTHRSNQVNAPEYVFLISELAGERRFASIVAKRLESLGALTHGDRRATEARDLSSFNLDSKYGRKALNSTLDSLIRLKRPIVQPPLNYKGNFFSDMCSVLVGVGFMYFDETERKYIIAKESRNVKKFLNRMLGLTVEMQDRLFKYFVDTHEAIIREEKRSGKFDEGILDLGIGGQCCRPVNQKKWEVKHSTGKAETVLYTVLVERGIAWAEAVQRHSQSVGNGVEGYYVSHSEKNGKRSVILCLLDTSGTDLNLATRNQRFIIFKPHTGQSKPMRYFEIVKSFRKVTAKGAQRHWERIYEHTKDRCFHSFWGGYCLAERRNLVCEYGMRHRTYFVLCGSILNVWTHIEEVFVSAPTVHSKLQIIRLKTMDGQKLVGTSIPSVLVHRLSSTLDEKVNDCENDCAQFESTHADTDSLPLLERVLASRANDPHPASNRNATRDRQIRKMGQQANASNQKNVKKEIKEEIEGEIKEEVKMEIKEEMKKEIKGEIKEEVKMEIGEEVEGKIKTEPIRDSNNFLKHENIVPINISSDDDSDDDLFLMIKKIDEACKRNQETKGKPPSSLGECSRHRFELEGQRRERPVQPMSIKREENVLSMEEEESQTNSSDLNESRMTEEDKHEHKGVCGLPIEIKTEISMEKNASETKCSAPLVLEREETENRKCANNSPNGEDANSSSCHTETSADNKAHSLKDQIRGEEGVSNMNSNIETTDETHFESLARKNNHPSRHKQVNVNENITINLQVIKNETIQGPTRKRAIFNGTEALPHKKIRLEEFEIDEMTKLEIEIVEKESHSLSLERVNSTIPVQGVVTRRSSRLEPIIPPPGEGDAPSESGMELAIEDVALLIDLKCDMKDVKSCLGIDTESGSDALDWKNSIRQLQKDVRSLKEFFLQQSDLQNNIQA